MKRWLVASLLVVLAVVLLVIVINSNRDPIAVLEEFGAKIKRNEQGEVVELSLHDTKITDAGLVHLKGLTGLQSLGLSGPKITDAGVADLQKALPNCKIYK